MCVCVRVRVSHSARRERGRRSEERPHSAVVHTGATGQPPTSLLSICPSTGDMSTGGSPSYWLDWYFRTGQPHGQDPQLRSPHGPFFSLLITAMTSTSPPMTAMADGMRRALQSIARDNNSRRLVFEGNLLRDIASRPRLERVVSSTISVRHHIPCTPESVARRGSANNTRVHASLFGHVGEDAARLVSTVAVRHAVAVCPVSLNAQLTRRVRGPITLSPLRRCRRGKQNRHGVWPLSLFLLFFFFTVFPPVALPESRLGLLGSRHWPS